MARRSERLNQEIGNQSSLTPRSPPPSNQSNSSNGRASTLPIIAPSVVTAPSEVAVNVVVPTLPVNMEQNTEQQAQNSNFSYEQVMQILNRISNGPQKTFSDCKHKFNGTRKLHVVDEFIGAIKLFKLTQRISDEDAIKTFRLTLAEQAATWWDGVKDSIETWEQAMTLLKENYAPARQDYLLWQDLFLRKQRTNETCDEFVCEVRTIMAHLKTKLDIQTQVNIILASVNVEVRHKIIHIKIENVDHLLKLAREAELALKEKQEAKKEPGNYEKRVRVRCEYCYYFGHSTENCRKKAAEADRKKEIQKYTNSQSQEIKCIECKTPGYVRSNCPKCKNKHQLPPLDHHEFYSLHTKLGADIPTIPITIHGCNGVAHIDTGARISLASRKLFDRLFIAGSCNYEKLIVDVTLANGSTTTQSALVIKTDVTIQGRQVATKMLYLPEAIDNRTLLGYDFLQESGIILDAGQNIGWFRDMPDKWFNLDASPARRPNEVTNIIVKGKTPSPKIPLKKPPELTELFGKQQSLGGIEALKETSIDMIEEMLNPVTKEKGQQTPSKVESVFAIPVPTKEFSKNTNQMETSIFNAFLEEENERKNIIQQIIGTQTELSPNSQIQEWSKEHQAPPKLISPLARTPPEVLQAEVKKKRKYEDILSKLDAELLMVEVKLREDEGEALSVYQKEKLNKLLENYSQTFNESKSPTQYTTHRINTIDNQPVTIPPYRLTSVKRELLRTEINQMLADGVIEECESAWASPVVLVNKPDGGIRFCVDYRQLNAKTIPDRYPLPRIDDLLHEAKTAPYMSTMDLKSGYWQIAIDEHDKEKTSFIIYLDDLIIRSETFEQHLENLEHVFIWLGIFNLKANREKCRFGCAKVKYLGHYITPKGLEADPDKTSAISDRKPPKNVKQIMSFIQTCSWYQRFIQDFAAIAEPLTKLTRKNEPWKWTEEQETAFNKLKQRLTSAPVLQQANDARPFILRTDASNYALGAVLSQGEGESEHPVEYASRLLVPAEINYSTTEKFRAYVENAERQIQTDHQPLKWLMSLKTPSGRLARWAMKLQAYNININYIPGKRNVVADTLSRPPSSEECTFCPLEIEIPRKGATETRNEQLKDEELKSIIESLELTYGDEHQLRYMNRGYTLNNGVLYRVTDESDNAQLVVPKQGRETILKQYHDNDTAGHYGVDKTIARIVTRYHWTGIRNDINNHVRRCVECQRYKASNLKPTGLLQSSVCMQRFEIIAIDLFGPLPRTAENFSTILIVEDIASKWVKLFPMEEATAEVCADMLFEKVILRFGVPRKIISDNGTQFISAIMQKLTHRLGIKQSLKTPKLAPTPNSASSPRRLRNQRGSI